VKILASPEAVEYIRERGGMLFVWTEIARMYTGPVTYLEASTESPGVTHDFQRLSGAFDLFVDVGDRSLPEEIHIGLKGWPTKQIRAYWNGRNYVL